jgi:hypothetical protein
MRLKFADESRVEIPFDTDDTTFSPPIVPTRPPIDEPIQVDIKDVPSQSISSMEGKAQPTQTPRTTAQETVERFGSLAISIEKYEVSTCL